MPSLQLCMKFEMISVKTFTPDSWVGWGRGREINTTYLRMKTRLPAVTSLFLPAYLQSLLCTFFLLGNLRFGKFRPLRSLSSKSLSKHPRNSSQRKRGRHTSSYTAAGLQGLVGPCSPGRPDHTQPPGLTLHPLGSQGSAVTRQTCQAS